MDVQYATTLPGDSAKRKQFPILDGALRYFPAAIAGLARHSWLGNQKHNKGQEMHHSRGKSGDHGNCIIRHVMDIQDYQALKARGVTKILNYTGVDGEPVPEADIDRVILDECNALFWRAGAFSQETHEKIGGAPLAPGAKV